MVIRRKRVVMAYCHIGWRVRLSRSMPWVRIPSGSYHSDAKYHHRIGKNASLLGTHALGLEFDSDARLSKRPHSYIVWGTVYWDMPFKNILR